MKIEAPKSPVARARLAQLSAQNLIVVPAAGDGFKVFRLVLPSDFQPLALVDATALVALSADLLIGDSGNGDQAIAYAPADEYPATIIEKRLREQGCVVNITSVPFF